MTYLAATQAYIDYCTANSIETKVFFTTGPVDGHVGVHVGNYTPEGGYQGYLKHERIRDYVKADAKEYYLIMQISYVMTIMELLALIHGMVIHFLWEQSLIAEQNRQDIFHMQEQ